MGTGAALTSFNIRLEPELRWWIPLSIPNIPNIPDKWVPPREVNVISYARELIVRPRKICRRGELNGTAGRLSDEIGYLYIIRNSSSAV